LFGELHAPSDDFCQLVQRFSARLAQGPLLLGITLFTITIFIIITITITSKQARCNSSAVQFGGIAKLRLNSR